jgi:hypothetical protein
MKAPPPQGQKKCSPPPLENIAVTDDEIVEVFTLRQLTHWVALSVDEVTIETSSRVQR